jgi:rhodanese-related sulfurtransferase
MSAFKQFLSAFASSAAGVRPVSAEEAARLVTSGSAVLVDVREPDEWADSGVAKPAHLLPFSGLTAPSLKWKNFLQQHKQREIILYCLSGARSGNAARLLARQDFKVANLGGLRAWVDAGLPLRDID